MKLPRNAPRWSSLSLFCLVLGWSSMVSGQPQPSPGPAVGGTDRGRPPEPLPGTDEWARFCGWKGQGELFVRTEAEATFELDSRAAQVVITVCATGKVRLLRQAAATRAFRELSFDIAEVSEILRAERPVELIDHPLARRRYRTRAETVHVSRSADRMELGPWRDLGPGTTHLRHRVFRRRAPRTEALLQRWLAALPPR